MKLVERLWQLRPNTVKHMTQWDPDKFNLTIDQVPVLTCPAGQTQTVRMVTKDRQLKMKNFTPIKVVSDGYAIYLDPDKEVPCQIVDQLAESDVKWSYESLKVDINNFHAHELLDAVLGSSEDVQAHKSFTRMGHLVYLNLLPSHEPYKAVIGQILMRLPGTVPVKAVINKTTAIESQFRNVQFEVVAGQLDGDKDLVVTVVENGRRFKLDFSKVYWNSRLSTEHGRIVDLICNDVKLNNSARSAICDVFAGVGPFAIPLAAQLRDRSCVLANDLNPDSHHWLTVNRDLNKISSSVLHCHQMDGHAFIVDVVQPTIDEGQFDIVYIIMNLPASAISFLPLVAKCVNYIQPASELVSSTLGEQSGRCKVKLFVYTFCSFTNQAGHTKKDVLRLCQAKVRHTIQCYWGPDCGGQAAQPGEPVQMSVDCASTKKVEPDGSDGWCDVHFVRRIAPNKDMFRADLTLIVNSAKRPKLA